MSSRDGILLPGSDGSDLTLSEKLLPWQQPSISLCCRLYGADFELLQVYWGQGDLDREGMHHRKLTSLSLFLPLSPTLEMGGLSFGALAAGSSHVGVFLLGSEPQTAACIVCFSLHHLLKSF